MVSALPRSIRGAWVAIHGGSGVMWWLLDNRLVGWLIDYDPRGWQMTWFETRLMWRLRLGAWVVCPLRGHDWYPDMCGRREHDLCARCDAVRGEAR